MIHAALWLFSLLFFIYVGLGIVLPIGMMAYFGLLRFLGLARRGPQSNGGQSDPELPRRTKFWRIAGFCFCLTLGIWSLTFYLLFGTIADNQTWIIYRFSCCAIAGLFMAYNYSKPEVKTIKPPERA